MNKKINAVSNLTVKPLLVFWCLVFSTFALAHSGASCNPVTIEPFTETPPIYMHEATSFRVLGKKWSTSSELKQYFDQQKSLLKQLEEQEPPTNVLSKVKLGSAGDVMRVSYPQPNMVHEALKEYLDTLDILNGNLETLISKKYPLPPDSLFDMNSDPTAITAFRNSQQQNYFTLMSLANNHTFDYPDDAIIDTMKVLQNEGIYQSGVRVSKKQKPYLVVEKNGIRIGYYAITTFVNKAGNYKKSKLHLTPMVEGIEPIPFAKWKSSCEIDLSSTASVLKQMEKDGADIKIISIHWGIEHDMYPQPVQLDLAHQLVQQGADIIVGSHPHVPQPSEICFVNGYEEKLGASEAKKQREQGCVIESSDGKPRKAMIYYSLGNLTSYSPVFWQQVGVIGELDIVKAQQGEKTVVDWYSPKYVYTFDYVQNPPHGKREVNLLSTYIARRCGGEGCTAATYSLVNVMDRHLKGKSFSWWEEFRIIAISTYDSLRNLIYWQFFAPQGK